MKASTLDAPLQIHCEGHDLLVITDQAEGALSIYASSGPGCASKLLVCFTHVTYRPPEILRSGGPLAEMAEEFAAEPAPKPRKRGRKGAE